jgi:hypothetical protein
LDPRPQAGSPLLGDALAGAPVATSYRGAFSGPSDNWADGWSGLSTLGYLAPAPPILTAQSIGGNLEITWLSLPGKTYQVESRTSLSSGDWVSEGPAEAGTGGFMTKSFPVGTGDKFFQLRIY